VNSSAISVQASIAKQRTLTDLLHNSANFESFLKTPPMDVILHLDLTHKAQKRGGFKMTAFGRSSKPMFGTGSTEICGKRSYYEQKNVETGITEVCLSLNFSRKQISAWPRSTSRIRRRDRRKI
jgi:hypothetical protein